MSRQEVDLVKVRRETIVLGAKWLRYKGFRDAADTLELITPGDITLEDLEWADAIIRGMGLQDN